MNHQQTIEQIYAAFGSGDVARILDCMSDDVLWEYAYEPGPVPWLVPRRGVAGVAEFFQALAAGLRVELFRINAILAHGERVVALIDLDAVVLATGRPIRERDEVHIWQFDPHGKVARFRHAADTLQHYRACVPGGA